MINKKDFRIFLHVSGFKEEKINGGFSLFRKKNLVVHEPVVGSWSVSVFYPNSSMVNKVIDSQEEFEQEYCQPAPESDSMGDYFFEQNTIREKRFSIGSGIEQMLRNAQIDEEELAPLFNGLVGLMKKAIADEKFRDVVLKIEEMDEEE